MKTHCLKPGPCFSIHSLNYSVIYCYKEDKRSVVESGFSVLLSNLPGTSYPVGIVPPRTKSPVPESSSIASYVTLRKSKKPDPRTVSLRSVAASRQTLPPVFRPLNDP